MIVGTRLPRLRSSDTNLETVQIWHLVVDNEAGDLRIVRQEIDAALVRPHRKVVDLQQKTRRIANGSIVIDDRNHPSIRVNRHAVLITVSAHGWRLVEKIEHQNY
jgi:hypothetical protein